MQRAQIHDLVSNVCKAQVSKMVLLGAFGIRIALAGAGTPEDVREAELPVIQLPGLSEPDGGRTWGAPGRVLEESFFMGPFHMGPSSGVFEELFYSVWEFPKTGTFFWSPYNQDRSVLSSFLGPPVLWKLPL